MKSIEIEKTFLVKKIPDLQNIQPKKIIDLYFPVKAIHPNLRVRKNGTKYEITKKIKPGASASVHEESTIDITEDEFNAFLNADSKKVEKDRYVLDINNKKVEIDVFQDKLKGLVLADFEFDNKEELENFKFPDFCLIDVTEEEFIAGGMLAGKSFEDISEQLNQTISRKI